MPFDWDAKQEASAWCDAMNRLPATISLLSVVLLITHVSSADDATLVRAFLKSAKSHVGTLVKDDLATITIKELATGKSITIRKTNTIRIEKPLTLDDAAQAAGIDVVVGWKLSEMAKQTKPLGKVAQVTPQVVYVSIGSDAGIVEGQSLAVYRNKGEIKDPDTGEVLAVERPLLARLETTEVNEKFSKAKIKGELEVTLEVGDEVEPESDGFRVAVFPLFNETGILTNVGAGIAEDMTTSLVQHKVSVVERSLVEKVLAEQIIQNTVFFEPKSAQKFGKLLGATAVLSARSLRMGNVGQPTCGLSMCRLERFFLLCHRQSAWHVQEQFPWQHRHAPLLEVPVPEGTLVHTKIQNVLVAEDALFPHS